MGWASPWRRLRSVLSAGEQRAPGRTASSMHSGLCWGAGDGDQSVGEGDSVEAAQRWSFLSQGLVCLFCWGQEKREGPFLHRVWPASGPFPASFLPHPGTVLPPTESLPLGGGMRPESEGPSLGPGPSSQASRTGQQAGITVQLLREADGGETEETQRVLPLLHAP